MRSKETLICIVAVALLIYSLTVFAGVGRELDRLKAEAGAAADMLGELEKENSSLQTSLEEGMSDEELERLARERLALVLPGEKIFYFVTDREEHQWNLPEPEVSLVTYKPTKFANHRQINECKTQMRFKV